MSELKNKNFSYQEAKLFPHIPVSEIERSEIETLYSFSHYDGPCTGLVRWKNRVYFVENISHSGPYSNAYWLVELTAKHADLLLELAELYFQYFGNVILWNQDGTRNTTRECPTISLEEREAIKNLIDSQRHLFDIPKSSKILGYFLEWQNLDYEER